jgi:hypothetical protein
MNCGDTFIIEDDDGTDEHLHVILTPPSLADEVVTVSISTRRRWSETLVCLQKGEHPWITRESVVAYHFAAIRTCAAIEAAVTAGKARPKEQASPELIRKILAGLIDSDFTPPVVLAYYKGIAQI